MTIQPASLADLEGLLPLARQLATSFPLNEADFRSSFAILIQNPSACLLVARLERQIVGYALASEHLTFYANGRTCWVDELMVTESHRRRGVGTRLMASIESWALSRECRTIALATRRAADFYTAIGYEDSARFFRKRLPVPADYSN